MGEGGRQGGNCQGKRKAVGRTGMGIWGGGRGRRERGVLMMSGKQVSVFCLPPEKANSFSWLKSKWFLPLLLPFWGLSHVTLLLTVICICFSALVLMLRWRHGYSGRSGLAVVLDGKVRARKRCLCLLKFSLVWWTVHVTLPQTPPALLLTTLPLCSDTVVKCNLGDRG